ncbi:MAG: hypothetical protein KDK27_11280, partial [Leptospiraceae bacterium]|nr:hypothetical protein [Leptospiraceae bacterium]
MKDDLPVDQKPVSPPDDFINFNPCEFNPAMRETETQLDIQLSSGYADRSRREQAARSRWEAEGILPSNPVATAAALSDGAVVAANGLGVAMCNVDGDWIKATEPLKASASGRTNLDLDFAGEENEDASVSAAVLVLAEADSEVAGESAETIENLATAGEVLGWLPGPVGEIAPVIIEAIANADAESSVTATFQYSIDPVPAARGAVSARAARHLIVKQGSFVSPPEDEYGQRHVVGGMISGSGSPGVGVQIDAECESNVRSDGLWAS